MDSTVYDNITSSVNVSSVSSLKKVARKMLAIESILLRRLCSSE